MCDEEYPPNCPECGKRDVEIHTKSEYTGGGYADRWDEFVCSKCGYEWRSETKTSFY